MSKHRILSFSSMIIGLSASIAIAALGTYEPLWIKLKISDPVLRGILTVFIALLAMLGSFLMAIYVELGNQSETLTQSNNDLVTEVINTMPHIQPFRCIPCEAAILEISAKLSRVKLVWNTRIVASAAPSGYPNTVGKTWTDAVISGLQHGLHFRDVISSAWVDYCTELRDNINVEGGSYDAKVVGIDIPSFMNFIILEYIDGSKELYFGWALSPLYGFDQNSFLTTEGRLIHFFESLFSELWSQGVSLPERQLRS